MSLISASKQPVPAMEILKYGDPVLRRKAKPVENFDEKLQAVIASMFRTMYEEPGVGLAAPQVGLGLRLMVVDVAPEGQNQPLVLINPKIQEKRGRVKSDEGCLSFPGISVTVPRAEWVRVSALNEKAMPIEIAGNGLLSRCLQHEFDHLDGVLMIDRLPLPKRLKVLWEIRKRKKAGLW